MLSPHSPTHTPTAQLTKLIADKLVAANFIAAKKRDEFEKKLMSGRFSQDDWKLWLEDADLTSTKGE